MIYGNKLEKCRFFFWLSPDLYEGIFTVTKTVNYFLSGLIAGKRNGCQLISFVSQLDIRISAPLTIS
jgi:hypothetical protein